MSRYDKFYEARELIVKILEKDLIGPVTEDEMLGELPLQYYAAGKLFPASGAKSVPGVGVVDDDVATEAEGEPEETESLAADHVGPPSAAGLTFAVSAGCPFIRITAAFAFYLPSTQEAESEDVKAPRKRTLWKRTSFSKSLEIALKDCGGVTVRKNFDLPHAMRLHLAVRETTDDGVKILTAALVNMNPATGDISVDSSLCAFQASLRVEGPDESPCFVPVSRNIPVGIDEEIGQMDMLYAHAKTWAQGHGCSAEWDKRHTAPLWVATTFLPLCGIHQMKSPSAGLEDTLSMETLATGPREIIISGLTRMAVAYRDWIGKLKDSVDDVTHATYVTNSIHNCQDALDRVSKGIELLKDDALVFRAFQLANEAMLIQQGRVALKNGNKPDRPRWRLFQLAFFLHEISSFALPDSPERKEADLLWFPTGGGKTEAYLGIAAFAIFLRRLRNLHDDGVTVIMRYTLRLLTLQQFERASILIFACEMLRERELPESPEIAIGFWVGEKMTPNVLGDAQKFLESVSAGNQSQGKSPCLIKKCPWCGENIGPGNYQVDMKHKRLHIRCHNGECPFSQKDFPVHLIDECLYEHLPAFVIATVDKFAQIPLQEKAGRILGAGTGKNPPDLIIQDELHLISGPLGTMTGIYEAAFQRICEKGGIPPKIIASTATIRNAASQIRALYGRRHTQFPPPGTSMRDSFFAVEADSAELPERLYAGVLGEGLTTKTVLIRVLAALLFATRYLAKAGYNDEVIDNFWTLTGYFNSLRELGGAYVSVLDDVHDRFSYLAGKKFAVLYPGVDPDKKYETILELTSRKESIDLPMEIQRLERGWKRDDHTDVYDFVLASNMISVGVDVGRLGTMTIVGQPKTSAEYIQASSRTGRKNPGLVITIYNAQRSRDRSHFEQFMRYHSALYRYVEASSLTPFSDRARDRGLQALFVSLCRCLVPALAPDNGAAAFNPSSPEVQGIFRYINDYVGRVDPAEQVATEKELLAMMDEWKSRSAQCGSGFLYRMRTTAPGWLIKNEMADDRFRMMNSLRSVEASSVVYIQGEE